MSGIGRRKRLKNKIFVSFKIQYSNDQFYFVKLVFFVLFKFLELFSAKYTGRVLNIYFNQRFLRLEELLFCSPFFQIAPVEKIQPVENP